MDAVFFLVAGAKLTLVLEVVLSLPEVTTMTYLAGFLTTGRGLTGSESGLLFRFNGSTTLLLLVFVVLGFAFPLRLLAVVVAFTVLLTSLMVSSS